MDLKGILSISGYGGLFKLIKQTKAGFIVESLVDEKRMQAFASSKISTLEDIAIYTETSEMQLKEVFRKIFELEDGAKLALSAKSSGEELKKYFEKILPDYDKDRVYVSDIKKVVLWYNLLNEKGMIDLEEDEVKEEESTEEKPNKEEAKKEETKKEPVKKEKKKPGSADKKVVKKASTKKTKKSE